jgi:hypothetical protein
LLDLAISHLRSDHQRSVVVIGNQIGLLDPCGTTGIQSGRGKVGMVASRYKCNRFGGPDGRIGADWLVTHPAVAALVPVLKARGTPHVLDRSFGVLTRRDRSGLLLNRNPSGAWNA